MSRLLSIIGPTATGKTDFALEVAGKLTDQFSVIDIISTDSRQIYTGMEVGTGADLPADFRRNQTAQFEYPFFEFQKLRIHGISVLGPDEKWSVAQFQTFTQAIIEKSWAENGLPILVGGTGLYHQQLWQEDEKLFIPPSERVREKAVELSVTELQDWLKKLAPEKFASLNNSDALNPRRLVRAIEVAETLQKQQTEKSEPPSAKTTSVALPPDTSTLSIGLTDTVENIATKIAQRVEHRLQNGMTAETQKLISNYTPEVWQHLPAFSATGYKEVRDFLEDKITREQLAELWTRRELQYAKRQLTWFKKYATDARWFTVSEEGWSSRAWRQIQAWLE